MIAVAFDDDGDGVPIVLAHGLTASRRYVVGGSKALVRGRHRVIAYDARGHGVSPVAEAAGYGYEALADDLLGLLDRLGIARAVLAGASMGAHTLARVALQAPERVRALVLVTPAYDPARDPGLERWDALSEGLRHGGVEGFVEAYGEPAVPAAWRDTVVTVLRQRLARHEHPEAVADALREVPRSQPFAALDDLAAIEAPTVVVGSRDEADPEHPLGVAQAWARRIPGASLVVEEAGASPIAWQGGQLSQVIADAAAGR